MFLELSPSQFTMRGLLDAPPGGDTQAYMFAVIEYVNIGYLSELVSVRSVSTGYIMYLSSRF